MSLLTTRRSLLQAGGAFGAAFTTVGARGLAAVAGPTSDWAWLVGTWDVKNRKLARRLEGDTNWSTFRGKSALWLTMGGLGTIDDNAFIMPDGVYRAAGIRAWDPATRSWAIWWLDARNPAVIDPPVRGGFVGDAGTFLGKDMLRGKPIDVRFHWEKIHSARPHWQQSFSPDGGKTWEMNFENFFTRTSADPVPVPPLPGESPGTTPPDWHFLIGSWEVRHRRLARRLVGSKDWQTFGGTLTNLPIMGGAGNFGDNVMHLPGGTVRGVGFRAYDPARSLWSSWFLDSRSPHDIASPLTGRFSGGTGTFESSDTLDGRPIRTRVQWSGIGPDKARWEQSASADDGRTWEVNWVSDLNRRRDAGVGA